MGFRYRIPALTRRVYLIIPSLAKNRQSHYQSSFGPDWAGTGMMLVALTGNVVESSPAVANGVVYVGQ